jgi:hypothetical protein
VQNFLEGVETEKSIHQLLKENNHINRFSFTRDFSQGEVIRFKMVADLLFRLHICKVLEISDNPISSY